MIKLNIILIFSTLCAIPLIYTTTECVWATGIVRCNRNHSKVVGSVVYVYDLDSPRNVCFFTLKLKNKNLFTV